MQPDQTPRPLFNSPYQPPVEPVPPPPAQPPGSSGPSLKKALVIAGVVTLLILLAVLLAAMSSAPKQAKPQASNTQNSVNDGPQPATASRVQIIDSTISQDISILNDERDFSADKFSDKNLGL
jgi:hypothetical protein